MVADEPELLSLPHPSQHDLHVAFARQSTHSSLLDAFPSFSNSERTVFLDDVKYNPGNCLSLLRWSFEIGRAHV